jgi:hypothetical protein
MFARDLTCDDVNGKPSGKTYSSGWEFEHGQSSGGTGKYVRDQKFKPKTYTSGNTFTYDAKKTAKTATIIYSDPKK